MKFSIFRKTYNPFFIIFLIMLLYSGWELKGENNNHKIFKIAGITNSPPLEFFSGINSPRGLYVELWKLWALKSETEIDYIITSPDDALKKLYSGEIDIIIAPDNFFPESSSSTSTDIIYFSEYYIYTNKRIPPVEDVSGLPPYRVGAVLNDAEVVKWLFPGVELVFKESVDELIKASSAGEINVFLAEGTLVNYRLTRIGKWGNFVQSHKPAGLRGVSGLVKAGNNDIIEAVNSGFKKITDTERLFIEKTWAGGNFKYRISWGYVSAVAAIILLLSGVVLIWLWNSRLQKKVDEATMELKQMKDEAEAATIAKGRFLDNISHELRTPLTLIIAPLDEALKNGASPDDENLKIIKRNSFYLLQLINDLLYLSGIKENKVTLYISETDPASLIKTSCEEIKTYSDRKRIAVNCSFPDEPVNVYIDREKFCRVIANFFSNSLKYTEPGGSIDISVKKDVNGVIIKFSDTGTGIPAEDIDTIFNRFSMVEGIKKKIKEGTGIGLAIVRETVELMGGSVSVGSRFIEDYPHNHGTDFYVKFPYGQDHFKGRDDVIYVKGTDDAVSYMNACSNNLSGQDTAFRNSAAISDNDEKPAILVAEDNPDMLNFLAKLLGDNFKVFAAYNGVQALEILGKEEPVDLILSDVMMPEMDGYEFMKQIRKDERYEDIPLLFLTARGDDLFKHEGLSLGAVDYVTKPFNPEELKLRIKNQIQLSLIQKKLRVKNDELYSRLKGNLEKREQSITSDNKKKMEQICLFIKDNYDEDLNRDMLASAAGMIPDTFSRLFNKCTGMNLPDYINRLRIEAAIELIETTDKSVTRISMETGFESLRTFNRAFKKITGESPGDYRARVKNNSSGAIF